jgi:hypothetical protein
MGAGAAIGIGVGVAAAGVVGAGITANAATSAANTQADAADNATNATLSMYNQNKALLAPYVSSGTAAQDELSYLTGGTQALQPGEALPSGLGTGSIISPFQPTLDQLSQTPGYQFSLGQGALATQNSYAAQGLGSSGAALKAGINYAESLAGTTYQNQFNNYLSQNQQIANILSGVANTGEAAAAQTATAGANAQNSANATSLAGAAANAAGTVGSANAIAGGLNSPLVGLLTAGAVKSSGLFSPPGSGSNSPTIADVGF